VEDDRGDRGQVVLVATTPFRFPAVEEHLGMRLGVAEHFLKACFVEGAVSGGGNRILRGEGRGMRHYWRLRREPSWVGRGATWRSWRRWGMTHCRKA